jgi:hypothetical protein
MADEVQSGALVGWKFRQALVLGHVKSVEKGKGGDVMLKITPVSKPESTVSRRREKVLLEGEMDKADVEAAMARHGHMARKETRTRTPKAKAMGLDVPSQSLPEPQAHEAKRKRQGAYKEEAAARKRGRPRKGGAKEMEEGGGGAAEEEAPPTPTQKRTAKPVPRKAKA